MAVIFPFPCVPCASAAPFCGARTPQSAFLAVSMALTSSSAAGSCTATKYQCCILTAEGAGAPAGSISCITTPTLEATNALMRHDDTRLILATGGGAMVKAAYSSGTPAIGVGAGQQFPLFGFGQHRQLCSVHAAQLHFVVHPNAPRSVLIFTGSMALRAKHYAREKLGAVIRFPIVLLRYG